MKLLEFNANIEQLKKVVFFLSAMCMGLLIIALILATSNHSKEEQWVLIPQVDISQRVPVSRSKLSSAYLEWWAVSVVQDLLTANPDSIDMKVHRFLAVSSTRYGNIENTLKKHAKKQKQEGISTVFYPKEIFIEDTKIRITGSFYVHFGRDKKPIITQKTYELNFERKNHGVLLVTNFKEIKNDE